MRFPTVFLSTFLLTSLGVGPLAAAPAGALATPGAPTAPAPVTPASSTGNLALGQAISQALNAHPSVGSAAQKTAQAQAKLDEALGQKRLQVTFTSTPSGSNADVIQPPPRHETFGSIQNSLNVPLPFSAKLRYKIQQAREELKAAQAEYEIARRTLVRSVSTAYYDLARKEALLAVARETLAVAERQLHETQIRLKAGDVPELDAIRAQVPVSSGRAALVQAENAVVVARQTLNLQIGQTPEATLSLSAPASNLPALPKTLDEARKLASEHSPELRSAEATIRANEANLAAARRWREPTFALQASDLRSNDQTSFSREDTIGATITLPLTDGGVGRAQVKEAAAMLAQSKLDLETTRLTVLTTVSTAYLNAQSEQLQIAAAKEAVDIAQVAYDKTLLGYQNGLYPLTDVLNAQSTLNQAKIALAQATWDALGAQQEFQIAIGLGGDETKP